MPAVSAEVAQGHALTRFFDRHFPARDIGGRILAIRTHAAEALHAFVRSDIVCLQTNRLLANDLERQGFAICTEATGLFELVLVEATKHKEENLFHIALAWSSLRPGGDLVLCAANALGGESLARRIKEAGLPIRGIWSLAKCRVLWLQKSADETPADPLRSWLELGDYRLIPGTESYSCPGTFAAHAIDPGTRLLCETLPFPLKGHGADFGAGCGVICRHILLQSDQITRMDIYDIERKALGAAELNLSRWRSGIDLRYHWADVTTSVNGQRFDWIVMNPPFHAGRSALPSLGQAFIRTAAENLKGDGTLWLVANRHLPYEATLAQAFNEVATVRERDGFKICRGSHPKKSTRPPRRSR